MSKTQIDRLGERLKESTHTESDLRLLDDYRKSFGDACEFVIRKLWDLGTSPTARQAKSTLSITEKLRRESIRLSQIQDIAGCRVVVGTIVDQDELVAKLIIDFPGATIIDRREHPSHGYRAVHVVVKICEKPIEIQVRSFLQQLWAEVSEKIFDVFDPRIKYGGGPDSWRSFLKISSESVALYEELEKRFFKLLMISSVLDAEHGLIKKDIPEDGLKELWQKLIGLSDQQTDDRTQQLQKMQLELSRMRNENFNTLKGAIDWLDKLKEQKQ